MVCDSDVGIDSKDTTNFTKFQIYFVSR